jgi:hypothetical protein
MKTLLAIVAVIALAVGVAAFSIPGRDSVTCRLQSTYTRDGQVTVGPAETVKYERPPGAREITLGEDVTQSEPDGEVHFSAVRINLVSGDYHWTASGPGWTSATSGQCK